RCDAVERSPEGHRRTFGPRDLSPASLERVDRRAAGRAVKAEEGALPDTGQGSRSNAALYFEATRVSSALLSTPLLAGAKCSDLGDIPRRLDLFCGAAKSSVQYTPFRLRESTTYATAVSMKSGSMMFAQCSGLASQPSA